jgi:hypothetical protein
VAIPAKLLKAPAGPFSSAALRQREAEQLPQPQGHCPSLRVLSFLAEESKAMGQDVVGENWLSSFQHKFSNLYMQVGRALREATALVPEAVKFGGA